MVETLKIWRISQTENCDYDTFDSAVAVAANEDDARTTSPWPEYHVWQGGEWCFSYGDRKPSGPDDAWTHPDNVKVELVGDAAEGFKAGEVICASFNAG